MSRTGYESPLRSLAKEVSDVARNHPCWSQVYPLFQIVDEYLMARARIEEINQLDANKRSLL